MTAETWVIPFLTHPLVLRIIAVIALAASFYVLRAVAVYVERVWMQRPRQFENQREFGHNLVPGLRRNIKIWS